jgi:hypothetical protein
MHSSSDKEAIFQSGCTSMHSFPILTTGQDFLHSCLHLFGLHLSEFTIAIRVCLSVSSAARFRDIWNGEISNYNLEPFTFLQSMNFWGYVEQKKNSNTSSNFKITRILTEIIAFTIHS